MPVQDLPSWLQYGATDSTLRAHEWVAFLRWTKAPPQPWHRTGQALHTQLVQDELLPHTRDQGSTLATSWCLSDAVRSCTPGNTGLQHPKLYAPTDGTELRGTGLG